MTKSIGALVTEHVAVGIVEDNKIVGTVWRFPDAENSSDVLGGMPAEEIVQIIARAIEKAREGSEIDAIGVGFPGINRNGFIEDSPNLKQTKGLHLGDSLAALLGAKGTGKPVRVLNDAAALAAGLAATRGQLDKLVRVWYLGVGIGLGRYPQGDAVSEGGHTVVTLDPKETFCGCGGVGHLEGIMGHRSMRLRFLDLEPEEVFEQAREGDERCREFVEFWHRALAAATASSIHIDGPGKFFISGLNARHVQANMLDTYLHDMVKMSPLQGSALEVVSTSDETAIIGAAVSAATS
ncbi:MAG: ROK family protein [Pyrinomonadaceae bacterium]|nr:ROK family protein [Pyrinomonadaceae bacterium]MDQ3135502.1 ROK family protein [Acidobacteriota bacterium]